MPDEYCASSFDVNQSFWWLLRFVLLVIISSPVHALNSGSFQSLQHGSQEYLNSAVALASSASPPCNRHVPAAASPSRNCPSLTHWRQRPVKLDLNSLSWLSIVTPILRLVKWQLPQSDCWQRKCSYREDMFVTVCSPLMSVSRHC